MFEEIDPRIESAQRLAEFADRGSLTEGQFFKKLLGNGEK